MDRAGGGELTGSAVPAHGPRAWRGATRPDFEARESASTAPVSAPLSLSSAARAAFAADLQNTLAAWPTSAPTESPQEPAPLPEASAIEEAVDAANNDPHLQLIRFLVELMTGQHVGSLSPQGSGASEPSDTPPAVPAARASTSPQIAPPRSAGFGIEYEYHAIREEFEQTLVSAEGLVKTSDGREINFKIDLSMTRYYREETSVSLRAGDAVRKDPLVLNFNGTAAQLSDHRFSFDLDGNGSRENIALLASGNGYLAIDRNGNGKIDSGRELFGPATDSGFGELAALDSDGNRWIDENDIAFRELRIWTPNAEGAGTLETLAQRQVGAIGLGHVLSPFELRGAGNSNLGAVLASGVFLAEDGRAGTVQEIDLSV